MTEQNEQPAIEVAGVTLDYGSRRALDRVSFGVVAGEIFSLLGPNGSGKTSLFRILATLIPPTAGQARVLGHEVIREARVVRRLIGVVFQAPSLDDKLSAAENLRHQGHLYGLSGAGLRARIREVLDRMGLADRASDPVEKLSGGLRRRVEVAKGLLHRPQVLLLDEPTAGLDPAARLEFVRYLLELQRQEGVTVLLTTHHLEEAETCGRLAILDGGHLVAVGSPAALKSQIGGDIIVLETPEPEHLRAEIRERFGAEATVLARTLRLERPRGHEFIPQLVEAFPGRIQSATLGKPTLEDVFIRQTGHRFWENSEAPRAGRE